jgi:hypothetical protein
MSMQLLAELTQSTTHVEIAAQAAAILPMAGDDLIGFTGEKINAVGTLMRLGSGVLAVLFVIMTAIKTRGAMAAIVVSGLSAAVFVWIVFNVTDLRDRVDNEMNSAPVPTSSDGTSDAAHHIPTEIVTHSSVGAAPASE